MSVGRRVVVTGLGLATPIGMGVDAFWNGLLGGRCGIKPITAFDASGLPARVAGELPPFSLGDYVPKTYRKSAKVMSRDIQIAIACAYHAVVDSGLRTKCLIERGEASAPGNVAPERFGANIGAGLISADLPELACALSQSADEAGVFSLSRWGDPGMNELTPLWLLKFLPNMLACHVTIVQDAQAPSNTITCAEASSHLAIGEAFRTIARGDADVCICGGAESKVNPTEMVRQVLLGRLAPSDQWERRSAGGGTATRLDADAVVPSDHDASEFAAQACRPFCRDRSGTAAAEGGGLVILEALEHAKARHARIYAELVGFGAASSAYHWSEPDPNGRGLELALRRSMKDAQTDADHISLVVPFGAGTVEHDAAEMAGWNAAFGNRLRSIPALTVRGATGNSGAGSGAIDFVAAVMALYQNTVPPSIHTDSLDPVCPFQFMHGEPMDADIRETASAASALAGGQSAALVIRKFTE